MVTFAGGPIGSGFCCVAHPVIMTAAIASQAAFMLVALKQFLEFGSAWSPFRKVIYTGSVKRIAPMSR